LSADLDKIMFAIYRETGFNRRYRVVYFTELDEKRRDAEIDAMLNGDPFCEGFIGAERGGEAKAAISQYLERLNHGQEATQADVERVLAPFLRP
jgi:hypothetical protein